MVEKNYSEFKRALQTMGEYCNFFT